MKISNRVKNIAPSGIRKFFDLAENDSDIISLGVGEPDFVTPRTIIDAAQKSLEEGKTYYTSNDGILELREAISSYLKQRFSIDYKPDGEIIVTVGASEAVDISLTTVVSHGDEVLIPEPCYVSYAPCVTLAGGVPISVPTSSKDGFKITASLLEEYITDKTRALIISYPSNPTGAILNKKELEEIADFVKKYDLVVISDEIYQELTYGSKPVSIASIEGMKERTFYIGGFSKAFAMTGWRIGYLCGPYYAVQQARKIHQYRIMCPPTISQIAALKALSCCMLDVRRMVDEYDKRRKIIFQGLLDMGLEVFEPKGAFYIFPSIKKTGLSDEEFAMKLLTEGKVAVVPGRAFGKSGQGHVRCSYATSLDNIYKALNRMESFLSNLGINKKKTSSNFF